MIEEAKYLLVKYYSSQISGWDIMSWANSIDENVVNDKEALEKLRYYDYSIDGYQKEIECCLLRLISDPDDETFGRALMVYWLERLEKGQITSSEFVKFLINMIYQFEDDSDKPCCNWAYNVFNENNGFGFINLEQMSPQKLHEIVYEKYE